MIYQKDNFYHIFNRGCSKEKIFRSDSDYRKLLHKMNVNKVKLNIEIISYCLLPNHYHFLLYQKSDLPISDLLRNVFNGYVQYYNRKYNTWI